MLASFVLALREGIEAALIIGIVLGVLTRMKRPEYKSVVWWGTISAVVLSLLIGGLLNLIGASFEGKAEQVFEGFAMILAAGLLTWMIFWMRRQAGSVQIELERDVRAAAVNTSRGALFAVAFLAVAREGIELALFLLAARFANNPFNTYIGAGLGLFTAILVGWILFNSTRKMNLRRFFQVTNILLILFAAGLLGYGVHEFNEAGWIPAVIEHVYDLNFLVNENSTLGLFLKALFGYNANPSLTEVIAYVAYLLGITAVFSGSKPKKRTAMVTETA